VNLEVDVVAKYVERLLDAHIATQPAAQTAATQTAAQTVGTES
jgi:riboflavin synthase alpha subunit